MPGSSKAVTYSPTVRRLPSGKAQYGLEVRRARGIHVEVLDRCAVSALYPALSGRISRGVLVPDSYYCDPRTFAAAVAARFREAGGRWLEHTVRGFRIEGDRVSAVETDGGRLGASLVVIAAGAWSRSLVRALGFDTPLDTERGYGVRSSRFWHRAGRTPDLHGPPRGDNSRSGLASPGGHRRVGGLERSPELRPGGCADPGRAGTLARPEHRRGGKVDELPTLPSRLAPGDPADRLARRTCTSPMVTVTSASPWPPSRGSWSANSSMERTPPSTSIRSAPPASGCCDAGDH